MRHAISPAFPGNWTRTDDTPAEMTSLHALRHQVRLRSPKQRTRTDTRDAQGSSPHQQGTNGTGQASRRTQTRFERNSHYLRYWCAIPAQQSQRRRGLAGRGRDRAGLPAPGPAADGGRRTRAGDRHGDRTGVQYQQANLHDPGPVLASAPLTGTREEPVRPFNRSRGK